MVWRSFLPVVTGRSKVLSRIGTLSFNFLFEVEMDHPEGG
jgi:hypothetical protein